MKGLDRKKRERGAQWLSQKENYCLYEWAISAGCWSFSYGLISGGTYTAFNIRKSEV